MNLWLFIVFVGIIVLWEIVDILESEWKMLCVNELQSRSEFCSNTVYAMFLGN